MAAMQEEAGKREAAMKAEIEALKAADSARAKREAEAESMASSGADASVKARKDKAKVRTARAEDLIIEATADLTLTRPEIVERVQTNWVSPDWTVEEIELYGEPYERATIYTIISDLVEHNMISPPPRQK